MALSRLKHEFKSRREHHIYSFSGNFMASIPIPAGLARRLAAAFYDALLLVALWFAASVVVLMVRDGEAVPAGTLWFSAYLAVVAYLFFGWFWTHGGQTLGMRAWRLQVRDQNGGPINWLQALRRYLAAYLSWLSVIGIIYSLFNSQRRAWHDVLSGSELVVLPNKSAS